MDDKQRGDDAQDHAPSSDTPSSAKPQAEAPGRPQDAGHDQKRTDQSQAIDVEDLNSANDEGAS